METFKSGLRRAALRAQGKCGSAVTVTCARVRQDPGETVAASLSMGTNPPPPAHIAQTEREMSNA